MKKRLLATVLAGAMVLSMAACGNSNANKTESAAASETANASTEAGAESGETQAAAQDGDASSELNIYMWQQYISDDLIKNFETENNCKVNLSYMSDNADAINKLTAGGGDEYDLIMTCDAYMKSLIAGGYVEELNLLQSGLKISTIDGARNLFPIALVALGYDPNSTNESEIAEAYEWLQKFNENVVAYGNAEQNLTNGTANVAVTYDGNASWAMKEKNTIKVADFTSDPIQLGIDLFVMPKGAKHVDLAEKFLNYICTAEVMAKNLEEFPYSCPNDAAVAAASDDYKNDPARDFSYKENVFFQEDVGDALTIYNDYYQKLKVGE